MKRLILGLMTHGVAVAVGFALGVYFLPILTAPDSPDAAMLEQSAQDALYTAEFTRDLRGSDFLHWGEGTVSVTPSKIVHVGALAPGPDYKAYLLNSFVEHEDEFEPLKANAAYVGDVKTFGGFVLDVPDGLDVSAYSTLVIWCESFGEFITAASYK